MRNPHQSRQLADLRTILEVTRRIGSTTDLQSLLQAIEQAARTVLRCERATVFLYDHQHNELISRIATGVEQIRFSADRGIAGQVARTGQVINIPDAYADPRFNPKIDEETGFRTRNMLTSPLIGHDGKLVGVLQMLNKVDAPFDHYDQSLAEVLNAQTGVALQRQMLLEEYKTKLRLQRDLDIARSIQQGLLPDGPPSCAGFDLAAFNDPADETGGDCFDFLSLPNGCWGITVADATGHGIGPALVMAECRALFRGVASCHSQELGQVVAKVNALLCEDLAEGRFVTAFFGVLDPAANTLHYCSAGQGPLFLYRRATGQVSERPASDLPLGIQPQNEFEAGEPIRFEIGDILLVLTDGFFEWVNGAGEQFGTSRLTQAVCAHADRSASEIITRLHEAVLAFAAGTPQADDLTAVVIKRLRA